MKRLIGSIFLVILSFSFFTSSAQEKDPNCPTSTCRAGELFTLKLVPGDKHLMVQLAGKKAADFKWTDVGLEAFVIINGKVRPLIVSKGSGGYEIQEQIERPAQLRFDLNSRGKRERIEIPLH